MIGCPPFFLRKNTFASEAAGVTSWQDPEANIQLCAVFHLDKVDTLMFVASGDNDLDFLFGAIEMYYGLRYLLKVQPGTTFGSVRRLL